MIIRGNFEIGYNHFGIVILSFPYGYFLYVIIMLELFVALET